MGEKSAALTNTIIVIVALVVILAIVSVAFPSLTETITSKMLEIVNNTFNSYTPSNSVTP